MSCLRLKKHTPTTEDARHTLNPKPYVPEIVGRRRPGSNTLPQAISSYRESSTSAWQACPQQLYCGFTYDQRLSVNQTGLMQVFFSRLFRESFREAATRLINGEHPDEAQVLANGAQSSQQELRLSMLNYHSRHMWETVCFRQ